ncbi:MAG: DUF1795 domain-containing protein [Rhodocyclaceae bacterium]|nr:DUF1795 domain-containing protein [Rhodocyclaceae bacterium]
MSNRPPQVLRLHEGSIALPNGYEDRTANLFVPVTDTKLLPNLSIARDWMRENETLPDYVTRQIGLLKANLPGHKVLARAPASLGREAVLAGEQIDASHKAGGQTIHQRQAAFEVAPRRALIFTATMPGLPHPEFDAYWRAWLASFTLRSDA